MYSQTRYTDGYRQDCSGFVSMCLQLDRSYTTRDIHTVLDSKCVSELDGGDVVWTPGHVTVFISWETSSTYLAAEAHTWRRPARYSSRAITSRTRAFCADRKWQAQIDAAERRRTEEARKRLEHSYRVQMTVEPSVSLHEETAVSRFLANLLGD